MTLAVAISIIGVIISALLGSGAVKFYLGYNTRLAIVERDTESSKKELKEVKERQSDTHTRLTVVEGSFARIEASLAKLHVLDTLQASFNAMKETVSERLTSVVGRDEHIGRWKALDDRDASQQKDIDELRAEVRGALTQKG
jgi:chromosome segregation ATPase